MNNQRRTQISEIRSQLESLNEQIETLKGEEQEAYDNMPDSLQYSERGQRAEEALDSLDSAHDAITEALNSLETAAE